MKKMKLIHYLAALALLVAAIFGTRLILGNLNPLDVIEMAQNVQVQEQPVEIPTEEPAFAGFTKTGQPSSVSTAFSASE